MLKEDLVLNRDYCKSFGHMAEKENMENKIFTGRELTEEEKINIETALRREVFNNKKRVNNNIMEEIWEQGWNENLVEFLETENLFESVTPKFLKYEEVIRFNGRFLKTSMKDFHIRWRELFFKGLFEKFLVNSKSLHEFGCGAGYNLYYFQKLGFQRNLYGYELSKNAIRLLNTAAEKFGKNIYGQEFDMRSPLTHNKEKFVGSSVLTIGAIEQLGDEFEDFFNFMYGLNAEQYVHVEPIFEFYNPEDLFDFYAISHHIKRGYPTRYFTYLREMEEKGKLEIVLQGRAGFGARHIDGYSYVIWKK